MYMYMYNLGSVLAEGEESLGMRSVYMYMVAVLPVLVGTRWAISLLFLYKLAYKTLFSPCKGFILSLFEGLLV